MSQELIGRSPDLKKLQDEGYGIEVKGGQLFAHQIPYLNHEKQLCYGTLISELTLASPTQTAPPNDHVLSFQGQYPCDIDGNHLSALRHPSTPQGLDLDVVQIVQFSNKPGRNYYDYHEKIATYADVISAPAKALYPDAKERNFLVFPDEESVFHYADTNSSRANITAVSEKLQGQKIAIVGVGGTGSYILDYVAKTPIQEIHLFDGDHFFVHNAFRAPGATSIEELNSGQKKVEYLKSKYGNMHKNIIAHDHHIIEENTHLLAGMSYVFIAIDKGKVKKAIFENLLALAVPFIDVGMGVEVVKSTLLGMLRVTTGTAQKNDHLSNRISFADDEKDDYASNIQIAELNALNAALAVIKWKKLSGFYNDLESEYHTTYSINVSQLINDETAA